MPISRTTELSDAELTVQVRDGDTTAYAVLWRRHEPAAQWLARLSAHPSDAEELVSEAFYRLLRLLRAGGGPTANFRAYLLLTVKRLAIDMHRRYYQRVALTGDDADLAPHAMPPAEDEALQLLRQAATRHAIAAVPAESRALLFEVALHDARPAQLAVAEGTTANAISSRLSRARRQVRHELQQRELHTDGSWLAATS